MIKLAWGRGVAIAALALGSAHALEELPQPTSSSADGYAVFYSGACAERVGIKVISGGSATSDSIDELVQVARQSVPQVLQKCPKAQQIVADVRSRQQPTLATYLSMSRTTDWKPQDRIGIGQLKSLLENAGYQVFAGPRPVYSQAYWRLEDNRFDVVYGNDLENRMVATHFEKTSDGYMIRGQVFDLGYHESGRTCENSRENHALWGSFSMTVSANLNALPVKIQWCTEHHESGITENTEFFDVPAPTGGPGTRSTVNMLAGAVSQLPTLVQAAAGSSAREPLIDREFYQVFATDPDFCSRYEFDVVYRVNHESRDSVFSGDYERAIGNVVGTLAARRCTDAASFTVNAYAVGDSERWDSITFSYREVPPGSDDLPFQPTRRVTGAAAKAYDATLSRLQFGECEGPFCELSGGRYLNAIYRGDLATVRQIDALHQQAVQAFLQRPKSILGGGALEQAFDSVFDTRDIQLLQQVANKYMHAYGMWGERCLDPGAETKLYEYTTPVIVETDEYGTHTSGGITFKTTYTLNPEFFPLRNQLASHRGAKRSDDPANLEVKGAIYQGIVKLTESGTCRSDTVKQFEQKLRELTARVMQEPGVLPPTDDVRPPKPTRVLAPAFQSASSDTTQRVAWNAPTPLPTLSEYVPTDSAPPAPMTQRERITRMNEEMQAAQAKFEKDITELQLKAAKARQQGASQAELMQMLQESQAQMLRLQQELQQEMVRIQQKYQ